MKTLFTTARNSFNLFNATLTPYDLKKNRDYPAVRREVKETLYQTLLTQVPDGRIDTVSAPMTIDALRFDKFEAVISLNDKPLFTMVLLSRYYKSYDFGITYLYMNEQTGRQLEAALQGSRFKK
ncbi:MAG TPA: hypothetical protein VHK69_21715 [Chitinophagaceae bacterium]|nr:hypothetical protein [Chitinophagaceae bacterium]